MFDIAPTELLLVAAVAVAVIPSKDLPRAMRFAGQWIGKARGMARHFRSGIDEMIRQSELEELEKKWRAENERIMREHPLHDAIEHPEGPPAAPALPAAAAEASADLPPAPGDAVMRPLDTAAAPPAVEDALPQLPFDQPPADEPAR